KEREIYRGQLADQKKPPQVIDKIIEGKLEKFFTEQCLLEQQFIKDASGKTTVRELVDGVNAKTGERIVVKRFARFQVGEGGEQAGGCRLRPPRLPPYSPEALGKGARREPGLRDRPA